MGSLQVSAASGHKSCHLNGTNGLSRPIDDSDDKDDIHDDLTDLQWS